MIGGNDSSGDLNKVWEGTTDYTKNEIEWKEMSSMPHGRSGHFAVVIVDNNIFVMGGR